MENQPPQNDPGDEFLLLLKQHEQRTNAYIFSLVPHWADAEEIAQEVRLRLWQQFDQYDRSKDFGAWARTIAYYMVLAFRERQGRNRQMVSQEFVEAVAQEVESSSDTFSEQSAALKHCVNELPASKRDLICEWYASDDSAREFADRFGRSYEATRKTILRIRMLLRKCVDNQLASTELGNIHG